MPIIYIDDGKSGKREEGKIIYDPLVPEQALQVFLFVSSHFFP